MKRKFIDRIRIYLLSSCLILSASCCTDENTIETVPQKTPCRITIDLLDGNDSRLAFFENTEDEHHKYIFSTWEEGDGFTIRNLNDNKVYTFILEHGVGETGGVFFSEETPADGDNNYEVFFPHTIKNSAEFNRYFNLKNPTCSYNDKFGYIKKALSMRHTVADYRDILFNNHDYGSKVMSNGETILPATKGSDFYKTTFLKINATNLPENFIPVRLDLKVLDSDEPVFYETNNSYQKDGTEFENSVTLTDYPEADAIEVYMPLSCHSINLAPGCSIQAIFTSNKGDTYTSTKFLEDGWCIKGGSNLIIHINKDWQKKEKNNDGTAPEWNEIIK